MRYDPKERPIPILRSRDYGSERWPLRQSDLSKLFGPFACTRQFTLSVAEYNEGTRLQEHRWPTTVRGSVIHAVIERMHHENSWDKLPWLYIQEWRREERRTDEPPINWRHDDRREVIREGWQMLQGYAQDPRNRNAQVVAQELSFFTPIAGKYVATGTVDQIRQVDGGYQILDFKTGQIPSQIELDFSYQLGIYATALLDGRFFHKDRPTESISFAEFPVSLALMRMTDYLPYERPVPKTVSYYSEAAYFGVPMGTTIKPHSDRNPDGHPLLKKGAWRGPVIYESRLDLDMIPSMERSISAAVSLVRLNRWSYANSSLACGRCPYRGEICRGIVKESGRELADLNFTTSSRRRSAYGASVADAR